MSIWSSDPSDFESELLFSTISSNQIANLQLGSFNGLSSLVTLYVRTHVQQAGDIYCYLSVRPHLSQYFLALTTIIVTFPQMRLHLCQSACSADLPPCSTCKSPACCRSYILSYLDDHDFPLLSFALIHRNRVLLHGHLWRTRHATFEFDYNHCHSPTRYLYSNLITSLPMFGFTSLELIYINEMWGEYHDIIPI